MTLELRKERWRCPSSHSHSLSFIKKTITISSTRVSKSFSVILSIYLVILCFCVPPLRFAAMAVGPRFVRYRKSWNPFVCTIEIPYTKKQLARLDAERRAQRIDAAQPAAEPVVMPVQVEGVTGEPQAMQGPPPAYTFCCEQCCGCYVHVERVAPYSSASANAVPAAGVAGGQHPAPNTPSVNAARQQTTKKNNANTPKSESKSSQNAAQQHKQSKRVHSAFKTTNTARDVKNVAWAMDQEDSSSSDSTVPQKKKMPIRVPPSRASSASRRAVKVAAEELMADYNDSETVSDDSSAVDDESKIPHRTTYDKRGLRTKNRNYRPRDSVSESDSSSSTTIDDSSPPRRRHRSQKHSTNTRQDKRRNKKHPHTSKCRHQEYVNKWKGDTSSSSGNDDSAPPVRSHYNSRYTTYTRQDTPRNQNYSHSSASRGQEYVDNWKSDKPHNQNYQHSSTSQGQEYVDNWKSDKPHNQNYQHSSASQGQEYVDNWKSDKPFNQNYQHSSTPQGQAWVNSWEWDKPRNQNYQNSAPSQGQVWVNNWGWDNTRNQNYQHSAPSQGQAWVNNWEADQPRNQNYPHSSASQDQAWVNYWESDKPRNLNYQHSAPSQRQAWMNNWESDKSHNQNYQHSSAPQQQGWAVNWNSEPSAGSSNNNFPQSSTAQRQEYVDNRKADTRSDSDDESVIDNRVPRHRRPTTGGNQPQPRQISRSLQGLPNKNHMGASDNRIPKIRLSSPTRRQPRRWHGTWSAQTESDSADSSTIDDRVPKHRRSSNSDSRSQSRHRSTQEVSGGVQGWADDNPVSSSRREQHNAIERSRSPSPFRASSHSDTPKGGGYDLFSDPLWRVTDDDPMSSYRNAIAQRAIQEAYQHGLSQSRSSTVKKEADSEPEAREGHGSYKSTKDNRNTSPYGTRAQSRAGSREPDHRVDSTRRVVSEPYRRKDRKQSFRSYSPSPDRERWSSATSDSESEPHSGHRERRRHLGHRSPTPPPSHKHSRKNRRSGSPSPSKARSDPSIVSEHNSNNPDLIFIPRTIAQKDTTQVGEGLHLKKAVSAVNRPSAPSYRSDSDSAPKKVRYEMSGGLGIGDKKKPKRSSKHQRPTVQSDSSDEYPIYMNSAGVTWRDV